MKSTFLALSLSLLFMARGDAQLRGSSDSGAPVASRMTAPNGRPLNTAAVDSIVTNLMHAAGVTGLCVGIIGDNQPVYVKSYGYKNRPLGQLNDTATSFYGASLSKAVFAYIVLQLVAEGLIDLDKPLYSYLPRPLPEYDNYLDLATDDRWKLLTARHCLDHTTGFPNWRFLSPHNNKKLEFFFTPGTRYAYSGEGLYLLQLVIEERTGRKLEELAREKVFQPLGMRKTSYLWQPEYDSNYAVGHTADADTLPKNRRKKANAAGSMETTIADMTRFVAGVMQGVGLPARWKDEMIRPQIAIWQKHQFPSLNNDSTTDNRKLQLSYGLGWGVFMSPAGKVFFKEGHDDGWQNYVIAFPEQQTAYVFLSNSDNAESIYKELTQQLSGTAIPWEWEGYVPYRHTVTLPENVLQQWTGEYDGKQRATLFIGNGQLRVRGANLPTMTLYAENEHHFFIKRTGAEVDFSLSNGVAKASVTDEGEVYELTKIDGNPLLAYEGSYAVNIKGAAAAGSVEHRLIVSVEQGRLFVEATSASDRLPKMELKDGGNNEFYLKDAPLKFRFVKEGDKYKLVTFGGPAKEIEWKRAESGNGR